jgi:hypothetical protein
MKHLLFAAAVVLTCALLFTSVGGGPAAAYENCRAYSFERCMECGAKYGYTGPRQEKFCHSKMEPRISCTAWCKKCKPDAECSNTCASSGNRLVNPSCSVRGNG